MTRLPSLLFVRSEDRQRAETANQPAFFTDLNLDQIVDAITAGRETYNLKPFFHLPLQHIDAIAYRHELFLDLQNPRLLDDIRLMTRRMQAMRENLAQAEKLYDHHQKEALFLDAVGIYCEAVSDVHRALADNAPRSRGLIAFRTYLEVYRKSTRFTDLAIEAQRLKADLAAIKYCILIKGDLVTVRKYQSEIDYGTDIEETFERFRRAAAQDYRAKSHDFINMTNVESEILNGVAQLYPDVFSAIDAYCSTNKGFPDSTVATFEREIQFYVAYIEFMNAVKRLKLPFCYPAITRTDKQIFVQKGFDLALAVKLLKENRTIICNDFYLQSNERILVVTGANQGGKTTFARMFGQLHYLASLGCPVPGEHAKLFVFDRLFTHFEREEQLETQHGKLQDDLIRIHDILFQATEDSIIILNEIFTSTTLRDAIFLSKMIMRKITDLDLLCVWVTFIDELSKFNECTVSMIATVEPDNPTQRTFKIQRRPADGLSYATAIARKYALTYERLRARVLK